MSDHARVTAADIESLAASQATILDVRTESEHTEQRLSAAHDLVPLDRLDPADFMLRRGLDKDAPVYLLCRSGMRAGKAAEKFAAAGYKNTFVIDGGILACAAGGIALDGGMADGEAAPSKTISSKAVPAKTIPLERQVRIVAGALVALGTLLGHYASPVFYLVPLFVGGGLIYAGITDRCGMALLLLKAPWNKSRESAAPLPKTPKDNAAGGCA